VSATVLIGKLEGNTRVGKSMNRGKNNIKMNLKYLRACGLYSFGPRYVPEVGYFE
jgi:hypothetical protein